MKITKLILVILILILLPVCTLAASINLNISENLEVTELGGGQVEIIATGILNIENPTNNSLIYEYNLKFKDEVNFQLILNTTNSINLNSNNTNFNNIIYTNKKILGRELNPKETKTINYQLKGIIPKTTYNNFYSSQKTLFEWYLESKDFSPLRFATLNKLDKLKDYSNGTFQRYIIIEGSNPTEFDVNLIYLNLFKTQSSNTSLATQFLNSQDLLETYENISLMPNQSFYFKTIDENSNDKTTYWIEYNIVAKINLTSKFILNYHTLNSGGKNSNNDNKDSDNKDIIIEKPLIFNKNTNKNILSFNDDLIISLKIQNPNEFEITNLLILDNFNEYFELIETEQDNTKININSKNLNLIIEKILPFETKETNYKLKFNKLTQTPILYFPPAKLSYRNDNIYSNDLNLINDIETQDKRLFIQKEIEYINLNTTRVHIKVKNIGEVDFENLIIVENEGELIIEQDFDAIKKNQWKIPSLRIGEEWATYYDVESTNVNKFIPEVYGADDAKIYKTILLNEKIDTMPISDNQKTYQIVIVGVAMILLVVDILF